MPQDLDSTMFEVSLMVKRQVLAKKVRRQKSRKRTPLAQALTIYLGQLETFQNIYYFQNNQIILK